MSTAKLGSSALTEITSDQKLKPPKTENSSQGNLVLVSDERLIQEGLSHLLQDANYNVTSCVHDLGHACRLVKEKPGGIDAVVVQIGSAEKVRYFESLIQLRKVSDEVRIVILAPPVLPLSFLIKNFGLGTNGYLETEISSESFARSLDLVMAGENVFPTRMAAMLANMQIMSNSDAADTVEGMQLSEADDHESCALSEREIEILRQLPRGLPNKVIARELSISEATVKVHVKGIMRKLGIANRTQAAVWAMRNGYIVPEQNASALGL